jgi:hypothetical protein
MTREDDNYDERDDDDGEGEPPEEVVEAKTKAIPPKKRNPKARNGVGGALGGAPEDSPREAELLWLWILARLPSEGRSAYDVTIQVLQLDPPASNGRAFMVGSFGGGAIRGSETVDPSQALISYVTDNFHMPRSQSRQSVTYQIRFIWASNSQQMKRGELTLPPRDEIIAVRQEEARQRQANGEPVTPYNPPPMHQQGVGVPQPWPQPFGFPPSYYPPPAGGDAQMMPQLLTMMQEMWRAQLEGRPPNPAAAGVAAPPPAPLNEDSIVQKTTASVLMALQQAGILTKPTAGVAAATPTPAVSPASPAASNPFAGMMEKAVGRMFEAAVGEVEKSVKKTIAGVGKPQDDDYYFDDDDDGKKGGSSSPASAAVGVGAPPTPPKEDAFDLPWATKPVADAKWGDGRPVVYAEDKETGNFSWQGALMSNPTVLEKGMEAAQGLAGALTNIVKQVGAKASAGFAQAPQNPPPQMTPKTVSIPPAATVVAETPAGAVDATPKSWKDGD